MVKLVFQKSTEGRVLELFDIFRSKPEALSFLDSFANDMSEQHYSNLKEAIEHSPTPYFLLVGFGMWEKAETAIIPYDGSEINEFVSVRALGNFYRNSKLADAAEFEHSMGVAIDCDVKLSIADDGKVSIRHVPILDEDGLPFAYEYQLTAASAECFLLATGADMQEIDKCLGSEKRFRLAVAGEVGNKKISISQLEPDLSTLLATHREDRTSSWTEQFLRALEAADLVYVEETPQQAPDGFWYLFVSSGGSGEPTTIREARQRALALGVGISLNPSSESADWVFTLGDILSREVNGEYYPPRSHLDETKGDTSHDVEALFASPSESILPVTVRKALSDYMRDVINIREPAVFLIHEANKPYHQLVFNVFPEDARDQKHLNTIYGRLQWFLPQDYAMRIISAESRFCAHFEPLAPV